MLLVLQYDAVFQILKKKNQLFQPKVLPIVCTLTAKRRLNFCDRCSYKKQYVGLTKGNCTSGNLH